MRNLLIFSVTTFLLINAAPPAVETLNQARIEYKLTIEDESIDPTLLKSMEQSSMVISFKDHFMKVEQNMGFVKTTLITDGLKKQSLLLSDMMGRKTAIQMNEKELDQYDKKSNSYEIQFLNDEKMIAGYLCKKATITDENGMTTLYISSAIIPTNTNHKYAYDEFKGFPLEIISKQNGFSIAMTATNVSKEVNGSFDLTIPQGYGLIDMGKYLKMMGNY